MTIHSLGALMRDAGTYTKHSDHGSSESRLKTHFVVIVPRAILITIKSTWIVAAPSCMYTALVLACCTRDLVDQDEMLHANADIQ